MSAEGRIAEQIRQELHADIARITAEMLDRIYERLNAVVDRVDAIEKTIAADASKRATKATSRTS